MTTTGKYYAGIGSRDTPDHICDVMAGIAVTLKEKGWILRSGGALGADQAFERGAAPDMNIYLPYDGFQYRWSNDKQYFLVPKSYEEIASKFHPVWGKLTRSAKEFHTRNVAQIIGLNDEPKSQFVVCWTSTGKASGGTGQAMRMAESYSIPICNLYNESFAVFMARNPQIQL